MNRIDRNSDEFLRGMALHYLKEHKSDLSFRARLDSPTIDALKVRGCNIDGPDNDGVHTVRLHTPFGELVTTSEWRESRFELLSAIGFFAIFKGGSIAVFALALYLKMGNGTAALWFWGWLCISGTLFPAALRKERFLGLAVAAAFFLLGWLVHAFGWSGR